MTSARGIALVIVLIALAVCSALGLGLVLVTTGERLATANYAEALQTANAADAALQLAVHELDAIGDWDDVLSGAVASRYVEGVAPVDLAALTNELTCGRPASCTDARRRT